MTPTQRARRIALLIALAALSIAVLERSTTDRFMRYAITEPPFTGLTYSVQTFLWWDHHHVDIQLDWINMMAFTHVKQTFAWEDVEAIAGVYDWSHGDVMMDKIASWDIDVVARLSESPRWTHPDIEANRDSDDIVDAPPDDFSLFGDYCGAVAARYGDRIVGYQIWNEPNLSREWGGREPNAAAYVELLRVCSTAIQAHDPDGIIISAGLAPTGDYSALAHPDDVYLQALYDAGFQRYVDVVGAHAPGFSEPALGPDEAEAAGSQRFFTFRRVEDLRDIMIANGDAARQMAILETGYTVDEVNPDYAWYAVDEKEQARLLPAAYAYAAEHWSPWVGLMSAIYMHDPEWTREDEEYWWSLTTPRYNREVYFKLANMPKVCGSQLIPERASDSPEALGHAPTRACD